MREEIEKLEVAIPGLDNWFWDKEDWVLFFGRNVEYKFWLYGFLYTLCV